MPYYVPNRKEDPKVLYGSIDDIKNTFTDPTFDTVIQNKQTEENPSQSFLCHQVSFVPIFDYERIFVPAHESPTAQDSKEQGGVDWRAQAIRNLESDSSLIHIFHERNVGTALPKALENGALNNTNTCNSKVTPKWTSVKRNRFYHSGFYETTLLPEAAVDNPVVESTRLIKEGAFPVYSLCTAMTSTTQTPSSSSQSPSFEYVAIGDSAGYVTLYTISPFVTATQRLETSASQREFLEDDEFLNEQRDRRKRGTKKIGVAKDDSGATILVQNLDNQASISSQCRNAIEILCFTSSAVHIVVGTKVEIECIDCNAGKILWTILLSSIPACFLSGGSNTDALGTKYMARGSITRLDAHPWMEDGGILASFTFGSWLAEEESAIRSDNSPTAPGLFLRSILTQEESQGRPCFCSDVIPKDTMIGDHLRIGPCAVVIWDRSKENRILGSFLTWDGTRSNPSNSLDESINFKHELILLDHDSQLIEYRTELPMKLTGSKYILHMALSQTQNGTYTIIASTKIGIRLFATEGLKALAVYGEGISLHGYMINWQDCFFLKWGKTDGSHFDSIKQWNRGRAREREDEVSFRAECEAYRTKENDYEDSFRNLFIVGIPHAFKEPLDINDTIHFWDLSAFDFIGGQKLPSFTMKIPGKSASINSLIYCRDRLDSEKGKLLLVSQSGDFHHLSSSTASDWAGAMYSPGYQLVDNNIIFIEDEDALDIVVDRNTASLSGSQPFIPSRSESRARVDHNQIFISDLELALKLSVVDQKIDLNDHNTTFDIIGHDDKTLESPFQCYPEPTPQASSSHQSAASVKVKPAADWSNCSIFDLLPYMNNALDYIENEKTKLSKRMMSIRESSETGHFTNNHPSKKRTKNSSTHDTIMDSIDLSLRKTLMERESFANGTGSLPKTHGLKSSSTITPTGAFCSACSGRMVRHACGLRIAPVDLSALVKATELTKGKERAEKMKKPTSKAKKSSSSTKVEPTFPTRIQDSVAPTSEAAIILENPSSNI